MSISRQRGVQPVIPLVAHIVVVACTNTLTQCAETSIFTAPPVSFDFGARTPHVAVRPDGEVTVIYLSNTGSDAEQPPVCPLPAACPPHAAGLHPGGEIPSSFVTVPLKPAAQAFTIPLRPQHAHRRDTNGIETYVVWDECGGD